MVGSNHTGNIQRREETHGADGNLRVLLDRVVVEDVDFEAAAAKVDDAPRRRFGSHYSDGRFAAQAGFLGGADNFQRNSGLTFYFPYERLAIPCLSRCARGDRAVTRDAVFVHHLLEVTKRLHAFFENIFSEAV